jgi:transcriptional regulator with XRE-family HTH domain
MLDKSYMEKSVAPTPLAQALYARMVKAGYNQKSLARKAELNPTYLADIFKGKSRSPHMDKLQKVADVLGCTVMDLILLPDDGDGQAPDTRQVEEIAREARLLALFRGMDAEWQGKLLGIAEGLPHRFAKSG